MGRPGASASDNRFLFVVEGVGFEPTNSIAERIYSPRPLATWISLPTNRNSVVEKPEGRGKGKAAMRVRCLERYP